MHSPGAGMAAQPRWPTQPQANAERRFRGIVAIVRCLVDYSPAGSRTDFVAQSEFGADTGLFLYTFRWVYLDPLLMLQSDHLSLAGEPSTMRYVSGLIAYDLNGDEE